MKQKQNKQNPNNKNLFKPLGAEYPYFSNSKTLMSLLAFTCDAIPGINSLNGEKQNHLF